MLRSGRHGEAIGPLKRAASLGVIGGAVWLELASAFIARKRWVAALGATIQARESGATAIEVDALLGQVKERLGDAFVRWHELTGV